MDEGMRRVNEEIRQAALKIKPILLGMSLQGGRQGSRAKALVRCLSVLWHEDFGFEESARDMALGMAHMIVATHRASLPRSWEELEQGDADVAATTN